VEAADAREVALGAVADAASAAVADAALVAGLVAESVVVAGA